MGCRENAQAPSGPAAPTASASVGAAALAFRQVSAGPVQTCAVTTADLAYCWGFSGPLTPTLVSGGLKFLEVSAGGSTEGGVNGQGPVSCGVTTAQRVYCWGQDLVPTEVPGGRRFRKISVGFEHICAVNPFDVAFCWGNNRYGQLGTGGGFFTTTPTRVAGGLQWRRVFAGASQTCGTTLDNKGYCWGWNGFGQGGTRAPGITHPTPTLISGRLSWRQVRPGAGIDFGLNSIEIDDGVGCGVTQSDRAYCWGAGALGSTGGQTSTPRLVAGGRRYSTVQPGTAHTCGLTLAGVAFCWGSNAVGQLGRVGSFSETPVRVAGNLVFEGISVAAAGGHTCGVTAGDRIYCWGANNRGQLGDGTRTNRFTPVAVVQ
jgi:alpha-tubulin suppressor-like RCC1 family protein